MKKIYVLVIILLAVLYLCPGCDGISTELHAPSSPENEYEREPLHIYGDGDSFQEAGYTYEDIKGIMTHIEVGGSYYYGTSLADITGEDLSPFESAFLESVDGQFTHVSSLENLYIAAYSAENGDYESVTLDGKHVYSGVTDECIQQGVSRVYLASTPADFKVEIQRNGEKIGVITIDEFLEKTPMEGRQVTTGIFEGSFMYDGGASTYTGEFIGISYEEMLAKLSHLGMDISGEITEVEYYGKSGLGTEGKNEEYSTEEGDRKKLFDGILK